MLQTSKTCLRMDNLLRNIFRPTGVSMAPILLAVLLAFTSHFAQAASKTVERTAFGSGMTRSEAIADALAEASKQMFGATISVQDIRKQLTVEETDDQGDSFAATTTGNRTISVQTPTGLLKDYEVLSATRDPNGQGWEAQVLARGLLYESRTGGASANRVRLAVIPFRSLAGDYPYLNRRIDPASVIGRLTQSLIAQLSQSRKFAVLDRQYVEEIMGEKNHLAQGDVPLAEQLRLGQELGADFLIVGTLTDFGLQQKTGTIQLTGETTTSTQARLVFEYRIIDVATREIRSANTYQHSWGTADLRKIANNFEPSILTTSVMQIAADTVANELIEIIYPIKVVKVMGSGQLILNQGGIRVAVGDRFGVFLPGEKLIDPDTGENLGSEEIYCGIAEIARVTPKTSYAKMIEGSHEDVEAGAICRPDNTLSAQPSSPAPPQQKAASQGRFSFPGSGG
jgi:TolB-like protein